MTDLSEIIRVESEAQDLISTLRVTIQLSIPEAVGLFREIFHRNPDITASGVYGATLLVIGGCKQPFDCQEVVKLLEEKLERAVKFSRIESDIPTSQVVAAWRLYEGSTLPDSFFESRAFRLAWTSFQSIQDGTQPHIIN